MIQMIKKYWCFKTLSTHLISKTKLTSKAGLTSHTELTSNKKGSTLPYLTCLFLIIMSLSCGRKDIVINVFNDTGVTLGERLVKLDAKEIFQELNSKYFFISDSSGKEIPSQLTTDSLILFMAEVKPGESKKFYIHPSDTAHIY